MTTYNKVLRPGTVLRGEKYVYRIDRVLGQGTFGITYLAYTKVTVEGGLGRLQTEMQVAVKEFFMGDINGREGSMVTTGGSSDLFDKYRSKFAREAGNLARLHHAGIVNVLEMFEANDTSYYAMEYCGGGSLDALIAKRGGLPEVQALRYFGQMAAALSYMHSQRMLHLDLKPGNVMLRASGEAVLIDFGLSKQFTEKGEPESSTTIGGGTPGYAPIEQANYNEEENGGKLPVTMDIYALGGTLYKMLTGKRPPRASDVLIEFPEQPLRDHGVSDDVVAAIRRAMEPKPHDRYQSVADFAAAIGCADEDTEPQPVPAPNPQPKPNPEPSNPKIEQENTPQPRRKWLPWAVGVAVAAVALVAVMLLKPEPQPAIDAPEEVVAVAQNDTVAATEQLVQSVTQESEQQQPTQPEPQRQQPAQQQQQQSPQELHNNLPEIAMVYVPGGTFTMGATSEQVSDANDDEKPAHSVTLSSYYIGKYEVTQELWEAVMGSNPSRFNGENLPVENVSWDDVQEFLRKLNAMTGKHYRLPTEAEWEFAARGGNNSRGYKYAGGDNIGGIAWYGDNSGSCTHAVGAKSPNELGIYDMSGNVWEWCQDWYGDYSSSPQRNPKGVGSGSNRVSRGGGCANGAFYCRVSYRNFTTTDYSNSYLGFRLAL